MAERQTSSKLEIDIPSRDCVRDPYRPCAADVTGVCSRRAEIQETLDNGTRAEQVEARRKATKAWRKCRFKEGLSEAVGRADAVLFADNENR